jgi:hypothetical protein
VVRCARGLPDLLGDTRNRPHLTTTFHPQPEAFSIEERGHPLELGKLHLVDSDTVDQFRCLHLLLDARHASGRPAGTTTESKSTPPIRSLALQPGVRASS